MENDIITSAAASEAAAARDDAIKILQVSGVVSPDEFEITQTAIHLLDRRRRVVRGAMVFTVLKFWEAYQVSAELQDKYGFASISEVVAAMADEDSAGKMRGLASEINGIANVVIPLLKSSGKENVIPLLFDNSSKARAVVPIARLADTAGPRERAEIAEWVATVVSDDSTTVADVKAQVSVRKSELSDEFIGQRGEFYFPNGDKCIVLRVPSGWHVPPSVNALETSLDLSSPRALVNTMRREFPKEV